MEHPTSLSVFKLFRKKIMEKNKENKEKNKEFISFLLKICNNKTVSIGEANSLIRRYIFDIYEDLIEVYSAFGEIEWFLIATNRRQLLSFLSFLNSQS